MVRSALSNILSLQFSQTFAHNTVDYAWKSEEYVGKDVICHG